MALTKSVVCLLVLFCLGWSKPSHAQQGPPSAALALSSPLLSAADTVAAVKDLFQAKRKSSGLFLAATPVALGLTVAGVGAAALRNSGSGSPNIFPPLIILGGGVTGTVLLLHRYTRYTKGNEREVLSKYQQTRKLPGWATRNLTRHRAAKP
jgi:hypothetical protein